MTIIQYYRHARNLGPFAARDCLAMARQAAALDAAIKSLLPIVAWYEINPGGTHAKFSNGITVY